MSFFDAGRPNAVTHALPYVGYFLAGHLLASRPLPRQAVNAAAVAFVGSTAVTALGTWYLARPQGWTGSAGYLYGYLSPTVIVASVAAFMLIRALPDRFAALGRPGVTSVVQRVSVLSFGVYLVHPLFQYLYQAHWPLDPHPSRAPELLVAVSMQWGVVCLASLAVTMLLRAVPVVRRLV